MVLAATFKGATFLDAQGRGHVIKHQSQQKDDVAAVMWFCGSVVPWFCGYEMTWFIILL